MLVLRERVGEGKSLNFIVGPWPLLPRAQLHEAIFPATHPMSQASDAGRNVVTDHGGV